MREIRTAYAQGGVTQQGLAERYGIGQTAISNLLSFRTWKHLFAPVRMNVSAYCPCKKCCERFADGVTASGQPVTANGGRFVAAPPSLSFGTMVRVPGYASGEAVPVLDRGGSIKGNRLDVFFPTHKAALEWGRQYLLIKIEWEKKK